MVRVTVVLDAKVNKKARQIHAKVVAEVGKSVSFSRIVNKLIMEGINFNVEKFIKELNQY